MPFQLDLDEGPKPENIVVDYERAVINTTGKIFPHARIQGKSFYFSETWIGYIDPNGSEVPAMYPPDLWGVYGRTLEGVWRTSNNAEAWRGAFGNRVDCAHPGIYKFLDELSKALKFIKARVEAPRVGSSLPPRDKTM
ncbi:hypothetical protein RvY_02728 [Ramazzottius varieornatus]|uniref:Uncharacterized protein n=1 Tax=Ramazzottius varieornatus TaxID=947166 RepID=A0A1D1UP54_RAMVA|nr:hypothetical protein RvY_02728 [Ramazzottius varieornatus]